MPILNVLRIELSADHSQFRGASAGYSTRTTLKSKDLYFGVRYAFVLTLLTWTVGLTSWGPGYLRPICFCADACYI